MGSRLQVMQSANLIAGHRRGATSKKLRQFTPNDGPCRHPRHAGGSSRA
jgi:hypothetical protein